MSATNTSPPVVRGWLAKLTTLRPGAGVGPLVLLAVGPRDLHTLGIEALASSPSGGFSCGTRTAYVHARVGDGSGRVGRRGGGGRLHLTTQRRPAVESLRAVAETGTPTYDAGNAFRSAAGRTGVPGTYLGETIAGAVAVILSRGMWAS